MNLQLDAPSATVIISAMVFMAGAVNKFWPKKDQVDKIEPLLTSNSDVLIKMHDLIAQLATGQKQDRETLTYMSQKGDRTHHKVNDTHEMTRDISSGTHDIKKMTQDLWRGLS